MLGIDGSEFANATGEHPDLGGPVILALSSINTVSVTDLTRGLSPISVLVKPVSHSALLKAVSGAMRTVRAERRVSAPFNHQNPGKRAHILVGEDNVTSQTVAVSILEKEGYEVTVARSGAEAVEVWDRGGVDLILMDVQMPGMNGLEATRLIRLKEAASGRRTTILALTAHAMAGDREHCLEVGMDDYISKPLQVHALRKIVRRWLGAGKENPSTA